MATVKHLSYAGITLPLAPSWLEEKFLTVIKDEPSFEVANYWNFDTPNSQSLPTPSIPKPPNWKLGVLNWPTGASRAAWFHTVVETDRLNRIKTAVGLTNTASPLVFYDGRAGKTITAQMRMLPERPLNVLGHDFSDLWLLTLTDQRFFWNWCRGNITQPVSWTELFSRLGTLLGVSITVEGIDARYGGPSAKWVLPYANTPVVLDAAAAQVGQRVVVGLDGTVKTVNWETARAASDAYIASSSRVVAGGLTSEASIGRYVPAAVDVLFADATTTPASRVPAVANRTLVGLAISQYGAATGVAGFKQSIYADLVYDGTNGFDAVNYANAAAEDWYGWRLPDTDIVYPGVEPWVPTGWEDTCEWVLKLAPENPLSETPGEDDPYAVTRVRRGPWLDFMGGDWYGGVRTTPEATVDSGYPGGLVPAVCASGGTALFLTVASVGTGACSGINTTQGLYLEWSSGTAWVSTADFTYDGGSGPVTYDAVTPVPTLGIDGTGGYFQGYQGGCAFYGFGGSSVCTGGSVVCDDYFVVKVCCAPCPTTDNSYTNPTQLTVDPGESGTLLQYVVGQSDPAPSILQFVIDAPGTLGVSQLVLTLTAPDGVTQYVVINNPPDITAKQLYVILDMTAPTGIQVYVVDYPDIGIGVFQAAVDYTVYSGTPNGFWQLTLDNGGDLPAVVRQFTITFGTPASGLTVTGVITPDTGDAPLSVVLSQTHTGYPFFYSIDWDDGSDPEFFLEGTTPSHTYSAGGTYNAVITAYSVNGSTATDTIPVTVNTNEVVYSTPGADTFTATYTGNHLIECWGGGGDGVAGAPGGLGGGGGGGGGYAASVLSLTAATVYNLSVGAGGANSTWETTTVVAAAGSTGSSSTGGAGGSANTGDTTFAGGTGGDGQSGAPANGGGGGSSAGTASIGANGNNGSAGAAGGTAPSGGGNGGSGGTGGAGGAGVNGTAPGGGGGGGSGGSGPSGSGASGKVRVTWPA